MPLPGEVCFERARLMTESYKETEGEPALIRRAKAFYEVLDRMPITINDDELIVGNVASKPRVAYFAPETYWWRRYDPDTEQVMMDHRFSRDLAIKYRIPDEIAEYWRHKPMGGTVGHFVPNYEKILKRGFNGLISEIADYRMRLDLEKTEDQEKDIFYKAAEIACQAAIRFAERHAEKAREMAEKEVDPSRKAELRHIAEICARVPAYPAETFYEALQAFWFTHIMIHINSKEWSISPGRFDQYMKPYYEKDIRRDSLTRTAVEELLACLWTKFNDVRIDVDFINYQNMMLGGQDEDGNDATNELSYLCLETTAKLKTFQPSISIRWHPSTPEAFLKKACETIKLGLGLPAMFNDLSIIPALLDAGVSVDDARNYAVAGCEELAVPGKLFGVMRGGTVNQAKCVLYALFNGHDPYSGRVGEEQRIETGTPEEFENFEEFMEAYRRQVRHATQSSMMQSKARDRANAEFTPHPFVSLLFDGCLESGRDITRGGAIYNITSNTEAGSITAANSLAAIMKAVFQDKVVAMEELKEALVSNFQGFEALRQYLLKRIPKFGNDDDTVDELAKRVVEVNHEVIQELNEPDFRGGIFATGSGGSTSYLRGKQTGATPDGRLEGETLSVNLGPSAGTDTYGPTAMLNSVSKLNWRHQVGGALISVRLTPGTLSGGEGTERLSSLVRAFFQRSGMGLHFTVADSATLRAARKEPEKYQNLLVRVGGFSAPFVLLSQDIQDNIIERTEHLLV